MGTPRDIGTVCGATLFDVPEQYRRLPKRMMNMLAMYGEIDNERCRTCRWLCRVGYHDAHYYKCVYNQWTHGPGSDWRLRWPACGLHQHGGPSSVDGPDEVRTLAMAAEEHRKGVRNEGL